MSEPSRDPDSSALSEVLGLALSRIDGAVLVTAPSSDGERLLFANGLVRTYFGLAAQPSSGCDARTLFAEILGTLEAPWALRDDLERFWGQSREERTDFLRQVRPEHRILERSTTPLLDAQRNFRGRLWVFRVASAEFEYKAQVRVQRQRLQWLLDFGRLLDRSGGASDDVGALLARAAIELEISGLALVEPLSSGAALPVLASQRSSSQTTMECIPEGPEAFRVWGAYADSLRPLAQELLWDMLAERAEHETISVSTETLTSSSGPGLAQCGVGSLFCVGRRSHGALSHMLVALCPKDQWSPERDELRFLEATLEVTHLCRTRVHLTEALERAATCTQATQEARSSLVALLSHELRTPLHPLVGFTQLLLESSHELPEDSKDMVRRIAAGAQRLQELVDDLLTITRLDDRVSCWQRYECDLRGMLEEAAAAAQKAELHRGITIERAYPPELPRIRADGAALRKAVRSLLSNAMRFSPENGLVRISVAVSSEKIHILVDDQCPGIPEEQREQIFEPFVQGEPILTRRHGGAGIGLTLVKRLAQSHGGAAWVETAPGGGSRFVLTLPRNPENTQ